MTLVLASRMSPVMFPQSISNMHKLDTNHYLTESGTFDKELRRLLKFQQILNSQLIISKVHQVQLKKLKVDSIKVQILNPFLSQMYFHKNRYIEIILIRSSQQTQESVNLNFTNSRGKESE